MMKSYDTMVVSEGDKWVAARLLTAVVEGWSFLTRDSQLRLVAHACLMHEGDGGASFPHEVLAFISRQQRAAKR